MKQVIDIPQTAMEVFNMLPEGTRCEVIDNAIYMSPSPTSDHQDILGDIFFNIKLATINKEQGKVFLSPLDVYLDDETSVVQPDIFFVNMDRINRMEKRGFMGAPDFIVEVLSSNRSYDKGAKFDLYLRNRVPEYIIIDPQTKAVTHYLFINDEYVLTPKTQPGIIHLKALDLQVVF